MLGSLFCQMPILDGETARELIQGWLETAGLTQAENESRPKKKAESNWNTSK